MNRKPLALLFALLCLSSAAFAQVPMVDREHPTVDLSDRAPQASTALESSHVFGVSTSLQNVVLYSMTVTIGATSGYLMIFDLATAPSNGPVTPKYCVPVTSSGTNGTQSATWVNGALFYNGVVAVFSTTGCLTLTLSATAFFSAQVR
jgi:hypothetical protein